MDKKTVFWTKKTGLGIAIVNLVLIINATFVFLMVLGFPFPAWLAFNICTPSVVLFLIGFFTQRLYVASAALPFLLFFGGGGLFVFGWSGTMLVAQAGHIAMMFAAGYIVFWALKYKLYKQFGVGLAGELVLMLVLLPVQQHYVQSHPDYMEKLGDKTFKQYINK